MQRMPILTYRSLKKLNFPNQLDPTYLINLHPTHRSLAAIEFLDYVDCCHINKLIDDQLYESIRSVVKQICEIRN